jgi:hypothetical protein
VAIWSKEPAAGLAHILARYDRAVWQKGRVIRAGGVVVAAGLVLAACSSGTKSGSAASQTTSTSRPAATSTSTAAPPAADNGEAAKSADEILADAQRATSGASTVHVSGSGASSGTALTIDAVLGHGRGGGTVSVNGATFDTVLDAQEIYLKADAASWSKVLNGNAAVASLLSDKWLKTTASNQDFSDFVSLLDISKFVSSLQPSGTVTKEPPTTLRGVPVIPLKDNGPDGGVLYVAGHGPPYIVAITGGASGDTGTIHFDQYNSATLPPPPAGAVDLNALANQGGSS